MEEFVIAELTARLDRPDPGRVAVRFAGRSGSRDAGADLAPLFARVMDVARVERRSVVLRFEDLEYFNSSTIAALVQFIRAARAAGIALEIVYDGRQRWQATSFDALRQALGDGAGVTFRDS